MDPMHTTWSTQQVADHLDTTPATITKMAERGFIARTVDSGNYRYPSDQFDTPGPAPDVPPPISSAMQIVHERCRRFADDNGLVASVPATAQFIGVTAKVTRSMVCGGSLSHCRVETATPKIFLSVPKLIEFFLGQHADLVA